MGGEYKVSYAMPGANDELRCSAAKKAMARTGSATSKRTNSASSSTSTISIKQKVVLSAEQQKVLTLVVQEGKNIFFTGSAGKSAGQCSEKPC